MEEDAKESLSSALAPGASDACCEKLGPHNCKTCKHRHQRPGDKRRWDCLEKLQNCRESHVPAAKGKVSEGSAGNPSIQPGTWSLVLMVAFCIISSVCDCLVQRFKADSPDKRFNPTRVALDFRAKVQVARAAHAGSPWR
jgi:hypothetical protein